jgi:hypothetical protein
MQELSDDDRKVILGEVLMGELAAIREYVQDVPVIKQKIESIDGRLSVVEQDVKIIKTAVTDISVQLHDHERRINRLETKAA